MDPWRLLIRTLTRHLPRHTRAGVARRLIDQANLARDGNRHALAAALYEEALRYVPGDARIMVQCGHMFKEAGDFANAGRLYEAARRLIPDDADLALQLGHFHKIAGQPDEAEASYRRALALRPGWIDAADELARLAPIDALAGRDPDWVVPELLPRSPGPPPSRVDTIEVWRLGSLRGGSRTMAVLRGVEAIRGVCISSAAIIRLDILVDGDAVHSEPLRPGATEATAHDHVFNVWHDFSDVAAGPHQITLRFVDGDGRARSHRKTVRVAPPDRADRFPASDGLVAPLIRGGPSAEDQINARPSVVRPVRRTVAPEPIRTILVQRADALGDLVCSVPALRRLRALFPEARLIGLLTAANAALGRTLGLFDEVVVAEFDKHPLERRRTMSIEAQDRLRRALAPYDFDVAIDLSQSAESRPLLRLSGARFLYGFAGRHWPWLSAEFALDAHDPVNRAEIMPTSRKIVALVEALGVMLTPCAAVMRDPDPRPDRLAAYGIAAGERFALLHAGAALPYSRWPFFGELAASLAARTDLKIILLSDDAAAATSPDDGASGAALHAGGRLPFEDFDALLSHCAIFVGNDSGPKHLAALRGVPVVSIHMARLNWSEWGQEISGSIISRRVPCAGCGIAEDGAACGKDFACIRHISADEVLDAVLTLL